MNPNDSAQKGMMDIIRDQREILLEEVTTKQRKNLDHIFGKIESPTFSQAFLNFISDHFAITIRIANNHTSFVNDRRLDRKSSTTLHDFSLSDKPQTPRRRKSQSKKQKPKKQRSVEID